jgi:hypothetical protein
MILWLVAFEKSLPWKNASQRFFRLPNLNLQPRRLKRVPEMQHEEVFDHVTIHDDLVVTPSNSCVMDAGGLAFLKPVQGEGCWTGL